LSSSVTFKGTVNGLTIVMNEDDPFEKILSDIEKKITSAKKFFEEGNLAVRYRGRKLSDEEQRQILRLLLDKSGVMINSFSEEANLSKQDDSLKAAYGANGNSYEKTKIFCGTVRSGQEVRYDGNVVIVGDVNPGANVIAKGNIIVVGSLRGMVHAGSDGDPDAYIVAFRLRPMQLRIADIITRAPEEYEEKPETPEIAYVRDGQVYIGSYCFMPS